jgi:hypothetical protein
VGILQSCPSWAVATTVLPAQACFAAQVRWWTARCSSRQASIGGRNGCSLPIGNTDFFRRDTARLHLREGCGQIPFATATAFQWNRRGGEWSPEYIPYKDLEASAAAIAMEMTLEATLPDAGPVEVDAKYEFDAPRYYDFGKGSPKDAQIDSWFAGSGPSRKFPTLPRPPPPTLSPDSLRQSNLQSNESPLSNVVQSWRLLQMLLCEWKPWDTSPRSPISVLQSWRTRPHRCCRRLRSRRPKCHWKSA